MAADAVDATPTVGWVGLGRIGGPMARRVAEAGLPLRVWARRPETLDAWRSLPGVTIVDRLEALAEGCDAIATAVGGPDDVQAMHAALMPAARPGTVFIELSTATPATARASAERAARHGHRLVDGPVTGGVSGARQGTLTCFAGGPPEALAQAEPVLRCFAARIVACGAPGDGYRTKLINQTLMAGALMGLVDAARMTRAAGVDVPWLLQALTGASGQSALLQGYLPRMVGQDTVSSFSLGLLLKDLRLARAACDDWGIPAPLLDAAIAAVGAAVQRHGPDAGMQALAF